MKTKTAATSIMTQEDRTDLFNKLVKEAAETVKQYKQYDGYFNEGWTLGQMTVTRKWKSGARAERGQIVLMHIESGDIWLNHYSIYLKATQGCRCSTPAGWVKKA